MTNPYFFGYGSLVNRATHAYPNATHATASGWRRGWVHTANRPFAYLTAVTHPGHTIAGLIAEVPGADWEALDAREYAYDRLENTGRISHGLSSDPTIAIYAVPPSASAEVTEKHPILLSYLDVVLQGYLQEFGTKAAEAFLETTDGWDAPIRNDRAAPVYPRHQVLDPVEQDFVDASLRTLGHTI